MKRRRLEVLMRLRRQGGWKRVRKRTGGDRNLFAYACFSLESMHILIIEVKADGEENGSRSRSGSHARQRRFVCANCRMRLGATRPNWHCSPSADWPCAVGIPSSQPMPSAAGRPARSVLRALGKALVAVRKVRTVMTRTYRTQRPMNVPAAIHGRFQRIDPSKPKKQIRPKYEER